MVEVKRGSEGLLIVLEGSDGCGKTTQARKLVGWMRGNLHLQVEHVREPGSTPFAEAMRSAVQLDLRHDISARTESFAYCAARSDLYEKVIVPKRRKGIHVVSERDYCSTLAYQGGIEGSLPLEMLRIICHEATGRIAPDLTLFYKPEDPAKALERGIKGREADRMESKGDEFHQRVYHAYYNVLPEFLREREGRRIEIIDSIPVPTPEEGIKKAHEETKRIIGELLRERRLISTS